MGAPSLSCGDSDDAYRFLWKFPERPALVAAVTNVAGAWVAEAIEFKPPTSGLEWAVESRRQRTLADRDLEPLFLAVQKAMFWSSLAVPVPAAHEVGSQWIIEGRRGTGYQVRFQLSPTDESFVTLAQTLVRLTGANVPPVMYARSRYRVISPP
jgi:hypothetical protein